MKIRTSPLDRLFSRYIRLRDKGICQRCGKYKGLTQGLDCAHYHSRRKGNTKYDEDNCLALCSPGCHQYFEENPKEFDQFMLYRLGQERYDMLEHRARQVGKPDKKAIELYLKQEIKELKEEGGRG